MKTSRTDGLVYPPRHGARSLLRLQVEIFIGRFARGQNRTQLPVEGDALTQAITDLNRSHYHSFGSPSTLSASAFIRSGPSVFLF
ncbi:hypothetical protein EVAR_99389_1 [Eumeta japonica]|uniref:Uncharacterized protein n=1 Tax=Eumeta variegata TaxID=151549 RepID=A0A4C2AA41_EUMVA|nr:hypothetical protein EVAR_99389_1 [Eumeta japonica]